MISESTSPESMLPASMGAHPTGNVFSKGHALSRTQFLRTAAVFVMKNRVSANRCAPLLVLLLAALIFASCTGVQTRVIVEPHEAEIFVGDSYPLKALSTDGAPLVWSSSDEAVATVEDGVVSALSAGQCTITAAAGNNSDACRITVKEGGPTGENGPMHGYTLLFHDEFDAPLDPAVWEFQNGVRDVYGASRGPRYWGNDERQYYTEDAAKTEGGVLTITATRQEGPENTSYTSARITTRDRFSFTYGFAEARIRVDAITGLWPAFWALPQPLSGESTQTAYGSWAANGEIDILEARGRVPDEATATLHFGDQGRSTYLTRATRLSAPISAWHTYGLSWRSDAIAWYIDGIEVFRLKQSDWWTEAVSKEENAAAPFDQPFYLLLNLAVGGNFDGGREPPEDFTEGKMQVDYVRVFAEE